MFISGPGPAMKLPVKALNDVACVSGIGLSLVINLLNPEKS